MLFTSGRANIGSALGVRMSVGVAAEIKLRELWRLGRKLGTDRRDRGNKERLVLGVTVSPGVSPLAEVGLQLLM